MSISVVCAGNYLKLNGAGIIIVKLVEKIITGNIIRGKKLKAEKKRKLLKKPLINGFPANLEV